MTEHVTARQVLAGVLRHEGADLAAHEMIRRAHDEAEGMERLSAEYLTLASLAQAERFDALLVRSGLGSDELARLRASEAKGPLFAAFRDAESRGLDIDAALPRLVGRRPRSPTGRPDPPGAVAARGLERRRLSGPLARHQPAAARLRALHDEHRAIGPVPASAGRNRAGQSAQSDRNTQGCWPCSRCRANRPEGSGTMSKGADANAAARGT